MTPALDAVRREELREIDRLLIRLTGAAVVYGSISDPDAQRELLKCQSSILATVEALLAYIAELEAKPKVKPPEWYQRDSTWFSHPGAGLMFVLNHEPQNGCWHLERCEGSSTTHSTWDTEDHAKDFAKSKWEEIVIAALLPKASVREERG